MDPLFTFKCSEALAKALGAVPKKRLPYPHLSFPVHEPIRTHHAAIQTENGWYAWLWLLDANHKFIERFS